MNKIITALFSLYCVCACTKNPATGRNEFTPFLPQSSEKEIGASEHRNIINQFGGEYQNDSIKRYVQKVSQRITSASEHKSDYYTVTILNSPVVNAFALPGGYLYATRALIGLANSEAELAAVIGHEAGHVTARHAANRSTWQGFGSILAMGVGVLTNNQQIAQLANIGAQGLLASYSRSHEYEADALGVRYLSRANYAPTAQASFLNNLRIHSETQKKINFTQQSAPSFFSTHPDTGDRVQKALALAQQQNKNNNYSGRLSHLKAINGMIWGDDPKQGVIQDRTFIHPQLRFKFKVPSGFVLNNTPSMVIANNRNKEVIRFDMDFKATNRPMTEYLQYEFAQKNPIAQLKKISLKNVKDAATALSQVTLSNGRRSEVLLYALRGFDGKVYRFMVSPSNGKVSRNTYQYGDYVASQFRTISSSEANKIKPYRITYRKIRSSDSFASLARLLPFTQNNELILKSLNGYAPQDRLPKSGYIKMIYQ